MFRRQLSFSRLLKREPRGREGICFGRNISSKYITRNMVFSFTPLCLVLPKEEGKKKKKKPSAFPFHPFFLVCLISLGCRWLDEKNSRQIKFGAWGMILGDRVSPACWSVHLSALCWLLSCELQVWPPPIHPLMSLGIGLFLHKSSRDEAGGGGDGGWCKFTQVVLQPEGGGGVGG